MGYPSTAAARCGAFILAVRYRNFRYAPNAVNRDATPRGVVFVRLIYRRLSCVCRFLRRNGTYYIVDNGTVGVVEFYVFDGVEVDARGAFGGVPESGADNAQRHGMAAGRRCPAVACGVGGETSAVAYHRGEAL